jgi:hypothetical protein
MSLRPNRHMLTESPTTAVPVDSRPHKPTIRPGFVNQNKPDLWTNLYTVREMWPHFLPKPSYFPGQKP